MPVKRASNELETCRYMCNLMLCELVGLRLMTATSVLWILYSIRMPHRHLVDGLRLTRTAQYHQYELAEGMVRSVMQFTGEMI